MAYTTYPVNNDNGVIDVSRDMCGDPIGEVVRELVMDSSLKNFIGVRNDAEERQN